MVERFLGKKEVVGPIPTFGSNKYKIVGIGRRTEGFSVENWFFIISAKAGI